MRGEFVLLLILIYSFFLLLLLIPTIVAAATAIAVVEFVVPQGPVIEGCTELPPSRTV